MPIHTVLLVYSDSENTLHQGVFEFGNMTELAEELSTIFAVKFSQQATFLVYEKDQDPPVKISLWANTKDAYINAVVCCLDKFVHESIADSQKFYLFDHSATSLELTLGGWNNYEETFLEHHS